MELPQYRSSYEYKEILRLLQKASLHGDNFIWQTIDGVRNVIKIDQMEIDFVGRDVVLKLGASKKAIWAEGPVYVKLDYRSSVFKIATFNQINQTLQFAFPEEIKTLELRTHERKSFHPNQEKTVSLKPSLGNHRDTGNSLNVRVADISEYGLGLIVSEQNRSYLKHNPILWLTHLERMELKYPILAEVVHISTEMNRKQKDLKVGLKLSGIIPPEIAQKFIQ
jgi:hypothetical protein